MLRWKLPQTGNIEKFSVQIDVKEVTPKVILKNEEGEDTTFNFFKLTPEQAKDFGGLLLAIFKSHEIPSELPSCVRQYVLETEANILDYVVNAFMVFPTNTVASDTSESDAPNETSDADKKESTSEKVENAEDTDTVKETEEKPAETEPLPKEVPTYTARTVILSIIDVIASLAFITAIVIALKPWLLHENPSILSAENVTEFFTALGNFFLRRGIIKDLPKDLSQLRSLVVFSLLMAFFILKLVVLCASKNGTLKIVSILLVLLSMMCFALLLDKFVAFILFVLVIYFCFELSCGFTASGSVKKLLVVAVISVLAYIIAHCMLIESIRVYFAGILKELALPVIRWF